jgi:homoserine dehydrogenase
MTSRPADRHATSSVRVALLGCGNVGSALAELLLTRQDDIAARTGIRLELVAIAVSGADRARPTTIPGELFGTDGAALVARDDVDVVVELIGGLHPAQEFIEAALRAVTTNFILTRMEEDGVDFADALAEAQRLGLAERDPSADVEGHDAAAKAAILAALAFGSDVVDVDVHREGISGIRAVDVAYANRLGYSVKLLAVAELVDGGPELSVRVHPAMVPKTHPLASVRGAFNAVFIEGAVSGELMLYGRGAGGAPTASAVLGDLVDAARNLRAGAPAPAPKRTSIAMRPQPELRSAFYLSMDVTEGLGVLAAVAKVFGDHKVSIRAMEQVGWDDEARLIFLTHKAREGDLLGTIDELRLLQAVDRVGGVLRVIGEEE